MQKRKECKHFTKIDLSIFYYCFELDEALKKYCTINAEFGCFEYQRIAMGVITSPWFAQAIMLELLQDMPECDVFLDEIGVWTDGSWEEHLRVLEAILDKLESHGLKCNPLKYEWGVRETDYLGCYMNPKGFKPWKKRVEGIL